MKQASGWAAGVDIREIHMAYASAPITARFPLAARLQAALNDAAEAWARYRIFRTTFNELSALSDRELLDLGLARANLKTVARETAYNL